MIDPYINSDTVIEVFNEHDNKTLIDHKDVLSTIWKEFKDNKYFETEITFSSKVCFRHELWTVSGDLSLEIELIGHQNETKVDLKLQLWKFQLYEWGSTNNYALENRYCCYDQKWF